MLNVKPIETEALSEAIDPAIVVEDTLLAATFAKEYLDRPLEEVDALVSLLGMARKLPSSYDRFGYDVEYLDEIVLRRVRKLVRACQNAIGAIIHDDAEEIPAAENFGLSED